ncbi:MAG: TldD/PmbA family protein [Armatimonadota bacterium]
MAHVDAAQQELALLALDTAQARGASYADVRIIRNLTEHIYAKNEKVGHIQRSEDLGFGVRVLANGSWGYASSGRLDRAEVETVAARAVAIGLASASLKEHDVVLAEEPPHLAVWERPLEKDPFQVSLNDKVSLLLECNREMLKVGPVRVAEARMEFDREEQLFASTEGSLIQQNLVQSGAGYWATAVGEGDTQRRSYPAAFVGQCMGRGYELIEELDLPGYAQQTAEEAAALLTAPQCESGVKDIILGPSQLCLQIHESVGHPLELDRVLGTEANFAGTSFVTPDKLRKLRYGSEHVTIMADTTLPGGLATVAYDDEGVEAQTWPLIERGLFVGYLTSRETAPAIGEERSRGAMRAHGWRRVPIVRMTNISLMPGEWTLEALIEDTQDGLYMETNKSFSIDQQRVNFQFGTEVGWEIKNGKKTRLIKNPTYQAITTQFWGSCDAVCNQDHWVPCGINSCGKGEPMQSAQMTHGAAPARFRQIKVGVAYAD